jgi:acid stress-induced BolA-like protein IbaG/YrbA
MTSLANIIKNNIIERFDYTKLNIINKLFFGAREIKYENDKFIENNLEMNKTSVNGGISSGLSSSYTIYKNNKKIDIWWEITFIELLRGRNEEIKEWIESTNSYKRENIVIEQMNYNNLIFSSEEQREAFLRKHQMIYGDITPESLYKNSSKISRFLHKHGLNSALFKDKLIQRMKKKKSICTSGLPTFLNVLSESNHKILNISDPDKIFNVEITLTYMDTELKKQYEEEKDRIREEFSDYNFKDLYNEIKKIRKPKEFNKKYTLDFNLNDEDFEGFKIKILEFIDSFYQEVIELEKTNYFNDYQ